MGRTWQRDERIAAVLAGATTPLAEAAAWREHLLAAVHFPFTATYRGDGGARPFVTGAVVQVIGLASEQPKCVYLAGKVMDGQRSVLVPLELLQPRDADYSTVEALSDWMIWITSNSAAS